MSDQIICKVFQLTIAVEDSHLNIAFLKEITNLGFKIEDYDPLSITGNNISYLAYTKLGELLNQNLLSKSKNNFSDHSDNNDYTHESKLSPTKQDEYISSLLDDSFDILPDKDDTCSFEDDLIPQFSRLNVTSMELDENDTTLLKNENKKAKLTTTPDPVISCLSQQAKNKEQHYISKTCSEDMYSPEEVSGTDIFLPKEEKGQLKEKSEGMEESSTANVKTIATNSLVKKLARDEPERKLKRSVSDNANAKHRENEQNKDSSNNSTLSCMKKEGNPADVIDRKDVGRDTKIKEKIERSRGEILAVEGDVPEKILQPSKLKDSFEEKNIVNSHVVTLEQSPLLKNGANKLVEAKEDIKEKESDLVIDANMTSTFEDNSHLKGSLKIEKADLGESEVPIDSSEDDCEDKTSAICSSKLSHQSIENHKTQPESVVFRWKKIKYLAALEYFEGFNLSEYSSERGNEFEITLNKVSDHILIPKIKEFVLEEIPISSQERALAAKKIVLEKNIHVNVSINEKSLFIFGPKKSVQSAKKAFLIELGNQDDIYMWTNNDSATSGGSGVVESAENAEEDEFKRNETKKLMNRDKGTNWEHGKYNAAVDCTSSRDKETFKKGEAGDQKFFDRGASSRHFDEKGQPFHLGSKTHLRVYVRKENITKLDVEMIVNAANRNLRHLGGVANAIASAAGYVLKNECNAYINTNGSLKVTDVFVSTGGLLKAKYVMHAVGPKWGDYSDSDKDTCLKDLRRTVIRCLVEASRLRKVSIALASISAAIFKVPRELCAHCYMEAVKHFDDFAGELDVVPVKNILFVDIDDDMVNIIQEKFINEWNEPINFKIAEEDFRFAQMHLSKKHDATYVNSAIKNKDKQQLTPGTKLLSETNVTDTQASVSNTISYRVNSIQISIVTKPATVYRSQIVVVGKLFDDLTGLKKFNVNDSAKPINELPKLKGAFQYLSLSKPDGSKKTLICRLYPSPDSPDHVTKAFENLENAREIHKSNTVVFTSAVFYGKPKKIQDHIKIISRFTQLVFDFARATSNHNSAIKSILISTSEDFIPHISKIFDSRKVEKILPGKAIRAESSNAQYLGHDEPTAVYQRNTGADQRTSGNYQGTQGGYTRTQGGYTGTQGGYTGTQGGYTGTPGGYTGTQGGYTGTQGGYTGTQGGYTGTQGGYQGTHIGYPGAQGGYPRAQGDYPEAQGGYSGGRGGYPGAQGCYPSASGQYPGESGGNPRAPGVYQKASGKQPPNGVMSYSYSSKDVDGYERKGSILITYYIPCGFQTEKFHHPSPGQLYKSISRTAYLPATDDGYRALELLRVAFHRHLIFTIDVSHTTNNEGIVWNIHHKTSPHSSEHGYPDPNYLRNLIFELQQNGVTEASMTHEEKTLVDEIRASFKRNTRV